MMEQTNFVKRLNAFIDEFGDKEKFYLKEFNKEKNLEIRESVFQRYERMVFLKECLKTLKDITIDVTSFDEEHPVTFLNTEEIKSE